MHRDPSNGDTFGWIQIGLGQAENGVNRIVKHFLP